MSQWGPIADAFREHRRAGSISRDELAIALNCTVSHISQVERDVVRVSNALIRRASEYAPEFGAVLVAERLREVHAELGLDESPAADSTYLTRARAALAPILAASRALLADVERAVDELGIAEPDS